jgi:hypothetical protein
MTPAMKNRLLLAAQLTLTAFLAVSFAASFLLGEEQYGFNGIWQRNEDESDDPQEKMQEAMEAMRSQGGSPGGGMGGGGRGGGGMMPGSGGGGRSGGGMMPGRGGGSMGRRGGPQGGPAGLMAMTARIQTTHQDNEFHVVPLSEEGRVQIFYLDGKKHKREAPNGTKIETKTEMKGNRIIVEQKTDRSEFTTTYELAPDATRMIVTTQFEGGRLPEPVIIRTVYDLTSETE